MFRALRCASVTDSATLTQPVSDFKIYKREGGMYVATIDIPLLVKPRVVALVVEWVPVLFE